MISFLEDTNYESIKTKRCSTIYQNSNKAHQPAYVEVYDDDSWAAYSIAPHCVPERTGSGRDSFYSAYPDAITTKKALYATIEYKSDHVGFLFGNELFLGESGAFPKLTTITNLVRDLTDMNNTQVVEFMSQMHTNSPYEIRVVRNAGLLYALEGRGFTVTH